MLPDGRRRSVYGATAQETRSKLTVVLRAVEDGDVLRPKQVSMKAYLAQWLEAIAPSIRPNTLASYRLNVRRLEKYIGNARLATLTAPTVQTAYARLLASGLAPRTVEMCHAVLHRALEQAVRWGMINRNVASMVSPPRPSGREMSTLTPSQLQQLFAITEGHRLHALWVVLGTGGLRLGEALGLKWTDIDWDQRRLVVKRALQRQVGVGLVLVEPKTAKSRRTVHLTDLALEALMKHRAIQAQMELVAKSWVSSGLIFTSMTGGPMESGLANPALRKALVAASLPRIRVHDLRHTAASLLMESGIHPKVVQEFLGHSTIALTLDTYSHVAPAMHRDAADQLEKLLRSAVTGPDGLPIRRPLN